jgi:hypothetical protein
MLKNSWRHLEIIKIKKNINLQNVFLCIITLSYEIDDTIFSFSLIAKINQNNSNDLHSLPSEERNQLYFFQKKTVA